MSATFNWTISTLERDIQPADMDGAIIVSHWRCTASQENEGTTYSASSYGTVSFIHHHLQQQHLLLHL